MQLACGTYVNHSTHILLCHMHDNDSNHINKRLFGASRKEHGLQALSLSGKRSPHALPTVNCAIQCRMHIPLLATPIHMPLKQNNMFHASCIASSLHPQVYRAHASCGVAVADACALNLAVYSSDVDSSDEQLGSPPVPVNALRNKAIALAATKVHVVPIHFNQLNCSC